MRKLKRDDLDKFIKSEFHYELPQFNEVRSSEFITYGAENSYDKFLLNLQHTSGKHNAILTGKVEYVVGQGVENDFLVNGVEDVTELIKKMSYDMEVFNGIAVEVIFSKDKSTASLNHICFGDVRSNKDNTFFGYTKNWSKQLSDGRWKKNIRPEKEEDYKEFVLVDFETKTNGLFYWKGYQAGQDTYPLPTYSGAIPYIEADSRIANFHVNNLKNGFTGGTLVNFLNGKPETQDQEDDIVERFNGLYTSDDNAGNVVFNFADGKDRAAEVLPLQPNNLDKQFDQLYEQVGQEIFTGHKVVSPMLFGVKTSGQLGGRTELIESSELFQNTYVSNKQDTLEKIILHLTGQEVEIIPTAPITEQLSEETLKSIMTTDELREKAGLEGIEPESAELLGALPDAIAAKVMENMTTQEIRALVGLTTDGAVVTTTETVERSAMCSHFTDEEIEVFKEFGIEDNHEVKASRPISFNDAEEVVLDEEGFKMEFIELPENERNVLAIVKDQKVIDLEEISKATKLPVKKVGEIIRDLQNKGHIEITSEVVDGVETPTAEVSVDVEGEQLVVLYKYVKRPDVSGAAKIAGTRDFCSALLTLNRLYSREEIDIISSRVGRNVWFKRGGFYNNPNTGITTPWCRHIWEQRITTINK